MDWRKDHMQRLKKRAAIEEYEARRYSFTSKIKQHRKRNSKAMLRAEAGNAWEEWERSQQYGNGNTKPVQPRNVTVERPPWED